MRQTDEDLTEHCKAEVGGRGACASKPYPIPEQDENGCCNDSEAGATGMQSPDGSWGGGDKGEEEAGRKPIDDARVRRVKVCGGVGDGGEREPLRDSF